MLNFKNRDTQQKLMKEIVRYTVVMVFSFGAGVALGSLIWFKFFSS